MRKLVVAIILLISFSAYGQSPDFVRTKKVNDQNVVDARPKAYLSLNIPHFPTWTLNGAKDSIAYVMYNTTLNKFGVYVGLGVWKEYATVEDIHVNIIYFGGKSDGIADNVTALASAKTSLGGRKRIHFPQNTAGNATYFFSAAPNLDGYTISSDDSVTFSIPTSNSINFSNVRILNNINFKVRDRNNTAKLLANNNIPVWTSALAGIDKKENMENLIALNATGFTKASYNSLSDSKGAGVATLTNAFTVNWALTTIPVSAAADSLTFDVVETPAIYGKEFLASISSASNATGGKGGVMISGNNEWLFFGVSSTGYTICRKKATVAYTQNYDNRFKTEAYRLGIGATPTISVRIINPTQAEFYVNSLLITTVTINSNINTVGWGVNRTINLAVAQQAFGFVSGDATYKVTQGFLNIATLGDSFKQAEGASITSQQYLKMALSGVNGLANINITNIPSPVGTAAGQLATLNATNVSGYQFVIVGAGLHNIAGQTAISTYKQNLTDIVTKIRADGSIPILETPATYTDTVTTSMGFNFPNKGLGGNYRAAVLRVGAEMGVEIADANADYGEIMSANNQTRDNLHPQSEWYKAFARSDARAILRSLQKEAFTGVPGQIRFSDYKGRLSQSSKLVYDSTNVRVGINQAIPTERLEVAGAIKATGTLDTWKANSVSMDYAASQGVARFFSVGANTTTLGKYFFRQHVSDGSSGVFPMIFDATGKVGINVIPTQSGVFAGQAQLEIAQAGTAVAGTAPLKFTTTGAALMTTPVAGAIEVNAAGDLFYTNSTPTRLSVANLESAQTFPGLKTFSGGLNTNLTTGSVPFIGASGLLTQDNGSLFWDNTNKNLGIGSNAIPSAFGGAKLYVKGTGISTDAWRGRIVAGGDNAAFLMGEFNSQAWLGAHNAALSAWADMRIQPGSGSTFINQSSGQVIIGSTTNNGVDKLQVTGTAKFNNRLTLGTGTTTIAPLNIPMGVLTTTPVSGNIENDGVNFSYTDNTATRRTMVNLVGAQTLQNKTFGAGNTWQGNIIAPAFLGTGTANASTFLSGDGIYKAVPLEYTISTKTANFAETATAGMVIIKGDTNTAGFTITLPSAVGNKSTIVIKKTAALNTLTVNTTLSQTIDTSLTALLTRQHESITLVSDNINWIII